MHSVVTRRIGYPRLAASNQTRGYLYRTGSFTRYRIRYPYICRYEVTRRIATQTRGAILPPSGSFNQSTPDWIPGYAPLGAGNSNQTRG